MKRFVPKYLDPASRLGEILFGLIMVLTITLTGGLLVDDGRKGVIELLVAAIGCNVAWGFIDAVMYLMSCITARKERAKLVVAVQSAPNPGAALALIEDGVEPELQAMLPPGDGEAFRRLILELISRARVGKAGLTMEDLYAAVACFILVFVSCLPAAIPFLIFSDPHFALRVSNALLLVLLFLVGRKWAEYVGVNELLCGSIMVLIGLALVWIAILLGG